MSSFSWAKVVAADAAVNVGYAPRFKVGDRVRDAKWGHEYTVTAADHRIATSDGFVTSFTLRGSKDARGRVGEHFDNPDRFELVKAVA
ncbi:MAG: hypothetical protein JWO85_574 [Candidatus Eremiobacteraeota bacterium]|nr:hypothetical protein [Candidatus Eremiobacteraeota bacterium]